MHISVTPNTTLTLDFTTTLTVAYGDDKEELRQQFLERVGRRIDEFLDAVNYVGDCDG
jgi:hypothetical protein